MGVRIEEANICYFHISQNGDAIRKGLAEIVLSHIYDCVVSRIGNGNGDTLADNIKSNVLL